LIKRWQLERIEDIVARVLKIAPDRITDDLAFGEIAEWDSLAHVDLMLELEAASGSDIDEDEMVELADMRALRAFALKHSDEATPTP
jgi:citrate synthase